MRAATASESKMMQEVDRLNEQLQIMVPWYHLGLICYRRYERDVVYREVWQNRAQATIDAR